jgi:Raf kinase inhibitor-like YbhB/YbcL family protein
MRSSIIALLVCAPVFALAEPTLTVRSSAFEPNGAIPAVYTCDGAELSPPLSWSNVPRETKSIAILVEDPDAPGGTFTHWLVTGISPMRRGYAAGNGAPNGALVAKNDKGNVGYAGPCPPSGRHHYHFRVFALDMIPSRTQSRSEFLSAIRGRVLAQGDLVGTYARTTESSARGRAR